MTGTGTGGTIVSASKDGVINPRHNLELLGAVLIGAQIADESQVQAVMTLLQSIGVSDDIQLILGGLALACARFLSWRGRATAKEPTT